MEAEGKVITAKEPVGACLNCKEYITKKYINYHVIHSQSKQGTSR